MTTENAPTTPDVTAPAAQFAIVELMGHRRYGARVSEVDRFGTKFLRAEIFEGPRVHEQLVPGHSIYALTYCTEAQARSCNSGYRLQSALPMLELPAPSGREYAEAAVYDPEDDVDGTSDDPTPAPAAAPAGARATEEDRDLVF